MITSVKTLRNFQKKFSLSLIINQNTWLCKGKKKTVLSCCKILEEENVIHLNSRGKVDVDIENTSWKVLAYGIYAQVVDVSEIERVSAANE